MKGNTSEQVSHGHPDKIADQISDAIADEYLYQDRDSRLAVETAIKNNTVMVFGEVKSSAENADIKGIARKVLNDIDVQYDDFELIDRLYAQSPDIALGTDNGGAGDQGIVVGFAVNNPETNYLPLPYALATDAVRMVSREFSGLGPDAKAQVTMDSETGRISTFLTSVQHREDESLDSVRNRVIDMQEEIATNAGLEIDNHLVNPTGKFVIGGAYSDAGLTGRKIIADTYGSIGRHGGGAFSGKDPSKVDRSAAYLARYVSKNVVAMYDLPYCEVRVAYAIGVPEPVEVSVNSPGSIHDQMILEEYVRSYDWSPKGIDDFLGLRDFTNYLSTASYGHFSDRSYPWERVDVG